MNQLVEIFVIESLQTEVNRSDSKTKKLFEKQKRFMSSNQYYPSLGRKKLKNVQDKYGNDLYEIRLDRKRRIIFVEKKERIIWLKICAHDELKRKNTIHVADNYTKDRC